MDPNKTLEELLNRAHLAQKAIRFMHEADPEEDADYMSERIIALHEWIIKGGFLPDQWKQSK